ncbi:hypothetical protein TcCL_ESM07811 [Trypanosoma cruzi]|nr:hypothetical protein TcCL_ESM07811 [Trypanosoma cruzi]
MDSDHHLLSHTAGTEDGIPRQAGMLPRRKHAAFALRAADWNDSTTVCATPLATVTTWLEMHRGTVRVAAVTFPHVSGRTECSRPSPLQRQHATRTLPHQEAACPELKLSANGRTAIMPSAVVSPCCWRSVQSSLVPSRAQACDTPRHGGTTSPLSGIGCAAVLLGLRLCSASAAGRNARPSHCPRLTCCDPHSCPHSLCSRASWWLEYGLALHAVCV